MKEVVFACVLSLASLLFAAPAFAATPAGIDKVKELGAINGVALFCRDAKVIERVNDGLAATLPKLESTDYEEALMAAIQKAFKQQQDSGAPCPNSAQLVSQVNALLLQLRKALDTH
jgi:hypothetical protein